LQLVDCKEAVSIDVGLSVAAGPAPGPDVERPVANCVIATAAERGTCRLFCFERRLVEPERREQAFQLRSVPRSRKPSPGSERLWASCSARRGSAAC